MRCGKWKSVQCSNRPGLCRGFTLLEVIIALGIVAVGILAVSRVITGYAETTATLEQRMVANWVAANRLEELRMLADKPVPGATHGSEEMADRLWYFRETFSTTADPLLFRVDVIVFTDRDETDQAGMLTGYLLDAPEIISTNIAPSPRAGNNQPPPVNQPTKRESP
ncbi:MAG: type II secretion system minor pseudopilin GspI [Pseudomonadota bacterium]|nr:type II secretion system minor pseudopilin GspI [Pseudomonadota bacterium]